MRLEPLKSETSEFKEAARIALRVASTIWLQNYFRTSFGLSGGAGDPWKLEPCSASTKRLRIRSVAERMTSKVICVLEAIRRETDPGKACPKR